MSLTLSTGPASLEKTRFIPITDGRGRPHRCRAKPLPSNLDAPGRPRRGRGMQWLRAYLTAIAKTGRGRRPWVEIDLNRCFNAKGYSLSWGRELFRRLQRDRLWNNCCKVRFIQKRLCTNGCFVILIAFRRFLKWDEEPLFYDRDRETPRHVRPALRAPDLEEPAECSATAGDRVNSNGHCPAHVTTHFLPKATAVGNNESLRPGAHNCGFAVGNRTPPDQSGASSGQTQNPDQQTGMRMSLNKEFSSGRPTRTPPGLRRFMIWLVLSLRNEMQWTGRVPFSFPTVFAFVSRKVRDGHAALAVQAAWQKAVEVTHADVVDGICRRPIALCVHHAERILRQRDRRSPRQRLADFYAGRSNSTMQTKPTPARPEAIKLEGELRTIVRGILDARTEPRPAPGAAGYGIAAAEPVDKLTGDPRPVPPPTPEQYAAARPGRMKQIAEREPTEQELLDGAKFLVERGLERLLTETQKQALAREIIAKEMKKN